jgi:hypothetical protein
MICGKKISSANPFLGRHDRVLKSPWIIPAPRSSLTRVRLDSEAIDIDFHDNFGRTGIAADIITLIVIESSFLIVQSIDSNTAHKKQDKS